MESSPPTWRDRLRKFFRPPMHADPDEARVLRVSYLVSWAIVIAVIPPLLLNLGKGTAIPEALLAVEFAVGLFALWLVSCGNWRVANSLLMFSSLAMAVGLILVAPNGMRDTAALILPTLVVLSALMMTPRASVVYAATVTLIVAILSGVEVLGIRQTTQLVSTDLADLVEVTIIVAVGGIATWLLSDQLLRSVRYAREQGVALASANTSLQRESARLRLSEERISSLVNASPDGIYQLDLKGSFRSCNRAGSDFLGVQGPAEVIGRNVLEVILPEEHPRALAYFARVVGEGVVRGIELRIRRLSGEVVIAEISAAVMRDAEERPESLMVVARDVTEKKRSQEEIERAYREQQVLLKEIHHRVKNNMQVISSLLSLQAGQVKEETVRELFTESQNRVRSMALVHEKLYRSRSLAEVDFGEYLESVVLELTRSYSRGNVAGHVSGRGVFLPVDTAIPCGLIVNELVSNSLKHAFHGLPSGRVDVAIGRISGSFLELTVRDDGIGISEEHSMGETHSMGMTIVRNLVEQINGTIETRDGPGTEFRILFPDPSAGKETSSA